MRYITKILPCLVWLLLSSQVCLVGLQKYQISIYKQILILSELMGWNRLQTCTDHFVVFLVGLRWKQLDEGHPLSCSPHSTPPRCWAGVQCSCLLITAAAPLQSHRPHRPAGHLSSSHNTAQYCVHSIVALWQTALGWHVGKLGHPHTMRCVKLG